MDALHTLIYVTPVHPNDGSSTCGCARTLVNFYPKIVEIAGRSGIAVECVEYLDPDRRHRPLPDAEPRELLQLIRWSPLILLMPSAEWRGLRAGTPLSQLDYPLISVVDGHVSPDGSSIIRDYKGEFVISRMADLLQIYLLRCRNLILERALQARDQ